MKKLLYGAAALATLLFASCQQENLEPVAEGGVTYTISLPDGPQTKGENGYNMYDLYYEVYRTVDAVELATATPLFEKKVVMDGNSTTVYLELLNDQNYTVLFWANKKDEAYFNTADLRNVEMVQAASNNDDRDAFCGMDQIVNINSAYTKTVELKRPFAQINIATLVSTTAGYDVTPVSSLVKVSDIPVAYNVATAQPVGSEGEVTYTVNRIPGGTITYGTESYTNVAMNYVLVPESNVTVYYEINTVNGTVTNEIPNVPVRANYRTNIVGNLLTSDATYTVKVEPLFAGVEAEIELVNTASALVEAITTAPDGGEIVLDGNISFSDLFDQLTKAAPQNGLVTVPAGKEVVLNLNGYSITGVDETEANFGLIQNNGKLIVKNDATTVSKMSLVAKHNNGWNRYSAVISNNPGAELTVEGNVVIEHLGGTDMAYGIDALTNGNIGAVKTTIDGATVTSTYRAVRQFLNSDSTMNELLIKDGSTLNAPNKGVFFHDPGTKANLGKLTIEDGASVGTVYLYVTPGSIEWPVEVSIAASSVSEDGVITANVPAHLMVANVDGLWTVVEAWVEEGDEVVIKSAEALNMLASKVNAGETFEGKTVKLGADIDLNNAEWTPIGSATQEHGFMGNFDGNGYTIKNLKMTALTPDADGYVYAGLFGVTEGAENQENYIQNLVIENVTIETSGHIVAAAVAYPYYTTLENITVKGNINIKGGNYTAGVLAYTRRCVNAKNIAIVGKENSVIEGDTTVGGVISDIQMNGGLTANYSNFSASGLTIKATKSVGGISGIMGRQSLSGATVKNVTLVCNDPRTGIIVGAKDGIITIDNVSYENVTGATRVIGATWKDGYYFGQILEINSIKAIVYTIDDGVKAVSVEELNLNRKNWQNAMDWAEGLGGYLATIDELDDIHAVRVALNGILEADNAENVLFEEDEYYAEGKYALYLSSTEATGNDPQGEEYFANRVHLKYFNLNGYWDYPLSTFSTVNKYAPLKEGYFARAVFAL